jgi:hypothetical protein
MCLRPYIWGRPIVLHRAWSFARWRTAPRALGIPPPRARGEISRRSAGAGWVGRGGFGLDLERGRVGAGEGSVRTGPAQGCPSRRRALGVPGGCPAASSDVLGGRRRRPPRTCITRQFQPNPRAVACCAGSSCSVRQASTIPAELACYAGFARRERPAPPPNSKSRPTHPFSANHPRHRHHPLPSPAVQITRATAATNPQPSTAALRSRRSPPRQQRRPSRARPQTDHRRRDDRRRLGGGDHVGGQPERDDRRRHAELSARE